MVDTWNVLWNTWNKTRRENGCGNCRWKNDCPAGPYEKTYMGENGEHCGYWEHEKGQ